MAPYIALLTALVARSARVYAEASTSILEADMSIEHSPGRHQRGARRRSGAQRISGFCSENSLSRAQYFKIRAAGHGPDEIRVPGTHLVLISDEASARWRAKYSKKYGVKAGEDPAA